MHHHLTKTEPATGSTAAAIRLQSPLSSFLSSLLEDRSGSTKVRSEIVVDNSLTHGQCSISTDTVANTCSVLLGDSVSILRTTSSSSSTLSSSRWDPNIFPSADRNSSPCRGSGSDHEGEREGHLSRGSRLSSSWTSLGALAVPVRRDSPQQRRRKEPVALTKKSYNRNIATTTAATYTGNKTLFGGGTPATSSTSSALLTCQIRQLSLVIPCDLFLPQTATKLMPTSIQTKIPERLRELNSYSKTRECVLIKAPKALQSLTCLSVSTQKTIKSSHKKDGGKTKEKSSSQHQSSRCSLLSPPLSVSKSSRTIKSSSRALRSLFSTKKKKEDNSPRRVALPYLPSLLVAAAGSEVTPIAARTPSPSAIPVTIPPKIKKIDNKMMTVFRLAGIANSIRFSIIPDDETDHRDDPNDISRKSVAVNRCNRRPFVLFRRPRRSALQTILSNEVYFDEHAKSSPRSTMTLPECSATLLTSVSPPPAKDVVSPSVGSKQARRIGVEPGTNPKSRQLLSDQQVSRSSLLASRRSLSETLLSCDRDTIDLCSRRNRNNKRAPPVQPIRQLSRALFEPIK